MRRLLMADETLEARGAVQVERSGRWEVGRQSAGRGRSPRPPPQVWAGGPAVVSIPGLRQGCSWQRVLFLMGPGWGGVGREANPRPPPLLGESGLDRASHPQLRCRGILGVEQDGRAISSEVPLLPGSRSPAVHWSWGDCSSPEERQCRVAPGTAPNQATYALLLNVQASFQMKSQEFRASFHHFIKFQTLASIF